MKRWLYIAAGAIAALVLAFLAGRYSGPTKVETRSVLDESLVSQAVTNAKAEWQRNVKTKTVTRTVYAGSGLPAERVTTIERDATSSGSNGSTTTTDTKADVHASTVKVTESGRPGWRLSAAGGWDPRALSLKPEVYELRLERRLVGTVWLGAWGRTDRTAGLSLGVEW